MQLLLKMIIKFSQLMFYSHDVSYLCFVSRSFPFIDGLDFHWFYVNYPPLIICPRHTNDYLHLFLQFFFSLERPWREIQCLWYDTLMFLHIWFVIFKRIENECLGHDQYLKPTHIPFNVDIYPLMIILVLIIGFSDEGLVWRTLNNFMGRKTKELGSNWIF